ncbi:caspase family protein [Mycolicibacterium farcinogenes]|nr:caspase family protein [Mycolicibacterium farcinogenes]
MRKALIVGINYYAHVPPLYGCVSDAESVKDVLDRHANNTKNFSSNLLSAPDASTPVTRRMLKDAVEDLFKGDSEIALFYFSGHGHIEDAGGYLCGSDCEVGDEGLSLAEVMAYANNSSAKNRVIILDCCHSGIAGSSSIKSTFAEINDGTTILTASTADQYSMEENGSGVFTDLFVDALQGAAANLVGDITPGSIYAHVDQSLGPWKQRPVFKTNVKTFVSLRSVTPPISLEDLHALTVLFPDRNVPLNLDPSFEPERNAEQRDDPAIPDPDPENNATFATLQKFARVNLVRPVGEDHMWHAAMNSKACELTALGRHYWKLVSDDVI